MINCVSVLWKILRHRERFCVRRRFPNITCGKYCHSWKKISIRTFDSIFYFSIKLPFHKFPLYQNRHTRRRQLNSTPARWTRADIENFLPIENSISWNWFMLRFSEFSSIFLHFTSFAIRLHFHVSYPLHIKIDLLHHL